jgi:hypothetical protein
MLASPLVLGTLQATNCIACDTAEGPLRPSSLSPRHRASCICTVHPASETCILQASTAFKSPSLALPPPVSPPTLVIDVQISHRHPHFRTLLEALKPVLMKPVLMNHPHGYVPMLQLPLTLLCTNRTKCTNQRIPVFPFLEVEAPAKGLWARRFQWRRAAPLGALRKAAGACSK